MGLCVGRYKGGLGRREFPLGGQFSKLDIPNWRTGSSSSLGEMWPTGDLYLFSSVS